MYFKTVIQSFIFVFLSSTAFGQLVQKSPDTLGNNFLPLNLGNQWQFLATLHAHDGTIQHSIKSIEIISDTIISGNKYYWYGPQFYWGSEWVRYCDSTKIIYINSDGQDRVFMDFNLVAGQTLQQFPFGGSGYRECQIIDDYKARFGNYYYCKGYYHYYQTYEPSEELFAEDFGPLNFSSWREQGPNYSYSRNAIMAVLYDSSGNQFNYSDHNKPQITVDPITVIDSELFSLDFTVDHEFSRYLPPGQGNGLDFIEEVLMLSFYFDGYLIYQQPDIIPDHVQSPANSEYTVTTMLDTMHLKEGWEFHYKFVAKDKGLIPEYTSAPETGYYICVWEDPVGVNEEEELFSYKLAQNYPNPFNPVTTINYGIGDGQIVKIDIIDALGRELITLVNEYKLRGNYSVKFDASELVSGIYFYRIQSGSFINVKKMVLIK
jgi:hypothetical protein